MNQAMNERLRAFTVVLVAALLSLSSLAHGAELPGDSVYRVAATLTDQNGVQKTFAESAGHVRLAAMFYASCGYVCPMLIEQLRRIESQLDDGERARLRVLLISLDPDRDTPQALAELASKRKLDLTRWTLAQPAATDLRGLSAVLNVQYRKLDDGEFNHSSVITLLDAEGRVLAKTSNLGEKPNAEFIDKLRKALAEAR